MRAPEPQDRRSSIRLLRVPLALVATAGGLAACADSLHLDAGDAGKTTTTTPSSTSTTTTSSGTGGGATTACKSNKECGYPTSLCDTVVGACVECLTPSDCAVLKPGTVCSFGVCECPKTDGGPTLEYCPSVNGAHCVDTKTSSTDCGGCGKGCFGACAGGACVDKWRPMTNAGAPSARSHHVSVWAKSEARMFVWGGQGPGGVALATGGLYDPAKDAWSSTSPINAPSARTDATAVWDDQENVAIVWGGLDGNGAPLNDGGMYDPKTDQWTAIPPTTLQPRSEHTAVWATSFAGSHGMIVWGGTGTGGTRFGDGAFFDPAPGKLTWTPIATAGAPPPRGQHAAVWSSSTNVMIITGGFGGSVLPDDFLSDAWSFEPSTSTWANLNSTFAPRAKHTAVFGVLVPATPVTVIFGGTSGMELPDGSIFQSGVWSPLDPFNFPEARIGHTAVWMDMPASQMIVLGGQHNGTLIGSAWSFDPVNKKWSQLPSPPGVRAYHTAVTTGATLLAWGGDVNGGLTDTGVIYTP